MIPGDLRCSDIKVSAQGVLYLARQSILEILKGYNFLRVVDIDSTYPSFLIQDMNLRNFPLKSCKPCLLKRFTTLSFLIADLFSSITHETIFRNSRYAILPTQTTISIGPHVYTQLMFQPLLVFVKTSQFY